MTNTIRLQLQFFYGKTIFGTFGKVMVNKFLSYHTLHVRSEGGYTHKTF